nr:transcription factor gsfr2 [Quercus suber]
MTQIELRSLSHPGVTVVQRLWTKYRALPQPDKNCDPLFWAAKCSLFIHYNCRWCTFTPFPCCTLLWILLQASLTYVVPRKQPCTTTTMQRRFSNVTSAAPTNGIAGTHTNKITLSTSKREGSVCNLGHGWIYSMLSAPWVSEFLHRLPLLSYFFCRRTKASTHLRSGLPGESHHQRWVRLLASLCCLDARDTHQGVIHSSELLCRDVPELSRRIRIVVACLGVVAVAVSDERAVPIACSQGSVSIEVPSQRGGTHDSLSKCDTPRDSKHSRSFLCKCFPNRLLMTICQHRIINLLYDLAWELLQLYNPAKIQAGTMPTPYRRSCRQCVTSKRRCTLTSPCHRCRVHSLPCSYLNGVWDQAAVPRTVTAPELDGASIYRPNDFAEAMQPASNAVDEGMLSGLTDHALDWNEIMRNIDDLAVPEVEGETSNSLPLPHHVFHERVVYAVKQIKTWPICFANDLQNPFININLYADQPPGVLTEALGLCSLYTHRNARNELIVHNCISNAVQRSFQEFSNTSDWLHHQRLSIVQALNTYRIIQLFDGDITMRREAEAMTPRFHALLRECKDLYIGVHDELSDLGPDRIAGAETDSWRTWLLSESIRRTILVGWIIECAYSFLKDGVDDDKDLECLTFFVQKSLWQAPSSYHWQRSLRTLPWLPAKVQTWRADTASVRPTDLDELGMIMTLLVKGLDYFRDWIEAESRGDLTSTTSGTIPWTIS